MIKLLGFSTLAVLAVTAFCVPVEAQVSSSYKYKQGDLQKAEWYVMRPQIQIVRIDPIVRVFDDPAPSPSYSIPLPQYQMQARGNQTPHLGSSKNGQTALVIPNSQRILAPAGFESNMRSLKQPLKAVMSEASHSYGLSGKVLSKENKAGQFSAPDRALIYSYPKVASADGWGQSARQTQISVGVKLIKRGQFLHR